MPSARTVTPHYTLAQAVAEFFPAGGVTVNTLRTEINRGHLQVTRIGARFFVTEADIAAMLARCRAAAGNSLQRMEPPACPDDDSRPGSICDDGAAQPSGKSETERLKSARDALRVTGRALIRRSPTISAASGNRPPARNTRNGC